MSSIKREVAASVSNQQSLVKQLLTKTKPKPTKVIIPGGANLLDEVSQKTLQQAIFNYIRYHRYFETFKISFAAHPEDMNLVTEKVIDFPYDGKIKIWDTPSKNKTWLAEQITEILLKKQVITLEVKPDGMYVQLEKTKSDFGPGHKDWQPFYEILPVRTEEYRAKD